MRIRPVALEVGREMTRSSQLVSDPEPMYEIIQYCRV